MARGCNLPAHPERGVVKRRVPEDAAAQYWQQAESVAAQVTSALAAAQGVAAKWTAVLTTAVGVLALTGILGGRDTIKTLPWPYQLGLGLAAAVAIAANLAMAWFGNLAGLGFPKIRPAPDQQQLKDADLQPLANAAKSSGNLGKARFAAIVAAVSAAAAIGLFLFSPASIPGAVKLTVKVGDSAFTTPCGTLVTDQSQVTAAYTLTPSGGAASTYLAADVTAVQNC